MYMYYRQTRNTKYSAVSRWNPYARYTNIYFYRNSSENQSMKGGGLWTGMGHYYCKHQMLMEYLTNWHHKSVIYN